MDFHDTLRDRNVHTPLFYVKDDERVSPLSIESL